MYNVYNLVSRPFRLAIAIVALLINLLIGTLLNDIAAIYPTASVLAANATTGVSAYAD